MISRRALLELAGTSAATAALLPRCGEMSFPLAPWHMWGNSIPLAITNTGTFATGQLVRVNYGRPETWSFLFVARLLDVPVVAVGVVPQIRIAFDLIPGVGRSSAQLMDGFAAVTGFCNFVFSWGLATPAPNGQTKFVTAVPAPTMDDTVVPPTILERPLIDHFPAQDFQCAVRGSFQGGAGALTAHIAVDAYFAPRTHIRPEWFTADPSDHARYRGEEQGGT